MGQATSKDVLEFIFLQAIYCWASSLPLKVLCFASEIPLDKTKFSFASCYQQESASELGMGICLLFLPLLYLILVPFLDSCPFFFFFLSYSDMLVFVLAYYIIFIYYPLEACLFSNERQKGNGYRQEGDGEKHVGVEGVDMETRIHYVRKNSFSIKRKKM